METWLMDMDNETVMKWLAFSGPEFISEIQIQSTNLLPLHERWGEMSMYLGVLPYNIGRILSGGVMQFILLLDYFGWILFRRFGSADRDQLQFHQLDTKKKTIDDHAANFRFSPTCRIVFTLKSEHWMHFFVRSVECYSPPNQTDYYFMTHIEVW